MATRPSRLERITNLFLALLETPRPLSLREIGLAVAGYPSEPGALRQAFERDKRTLREEGVPIAVERVDGEEQVGYRILPEEYYLPDLGLGDDEREALTFALAAVRLEGDLGGGAIAKLAPGAVPELPPVAVLPALPALAVLQEAIRTRAVARFGYHGKKRAVQGHGLVFRLGAWYLVGRDGSAGDELRTFRVDRIEDSPELGEPGAYEPPEGRAELRFAPWLGQDGGAGRDEVSDGNSAADDHESSTTEVDLDVDVRELAYAKALLGERALVQRSDDGSARFRFPVADEEAFLAWILGRGDAVEVVAPAALRERVIAAFEQLAGTDAAVLR
ncbi:MAG: pafB [Acidimicrobiaceae bacterium]|nr:pafB [Acidimicrobiaceae bacterium]